MEEQTPSGMSRRRALFSLGAAAAAPSMLASGLGAASMKAAGTVAAHAMNGDAFAELVAECADLQGEMQALSSLNAPRALLQQFAFFGKAGQSTSGLGALSPADLLSEGGMREFFLSHGGSATDAAWKQSALFQPGGEWSQFTQFLSDVGAGPDTHVPMTELQRAFGERAQSMLKPQLQAAYRANPQAVLKALHEEPNLSDAARSDMESWISASPENASTPEPVAGESPANAHYTLVRMGYQQGKHRYLIVQEDERSSFSEIREQLQSAHAALNDPELLWRSPAVLAIAGSDADKTLHQLAQHVKTIPQPKILAGECRNAALQCAATAKEMQR